MAKTQRKPSDEQAENFHVLPKRDAQPDHGAKPALVQNTVAYTERDPEAGSITGAGTSAELTPSADDPRFDRSQVS